MKKIAFDIKYRPEIESGRYKVTTLYDEPVEILKWDVLGADGPIVGLVTTRNGNDVSCTVCRFREDTVNLLITTDDADLTTFESALADFLMKNRKIPLHLEPMINIIHSASRRLLALAKEEIENSETYQEEQCHNYNSAFRTGMNFAERIAGHEKIATPAEWSEKDAKNLAKINSALSKVYGIQQVRELVDYISSLIPFSRWCPNESQMVALRDVCVEKKSTHDGAILCELCMALEKLIKIKSKQL